MSNERVKLSEFSSIGSPIPVRNEATLAQEYELGEIVEVDEEGPGIIAAFVEESFEFPVGAAEDRMEEIEDEDEEPEMKEVDASQENPMYIVALQDGGSVAASADEISSGSLEDDDGKDIESWGDVGADADETELAEVYEYTDDPSSFVELQQAKKRYIIDHNRAELAQYADKHDIPIDEWETMSVAELVNIRGVDDPHVGFDSMPNGWTRKSVLQAWASLGGMWRTCYARMIREFGPFMAKRWCAALKDEVLRTEMWRNKF